MKIQPVHWALLLALVALWGSSYLMVEIALAVWRPEQITGLRILSAAVVLVIAMLVRGQRFPLIWRSWRYFLGIAVIGNCLPFFLISWGQQEVESGLAGILAASTPLVVLILAHFVLADERLSLRHVFAFVFGFAGIVVLMGTGILCRIGRLGQSLVIPGRDPRRRSVLCGRHGDGETDAGNISGRYIGRGHGVGE